MHVTMSGDQGGRDVLLLHGGGVGGWMWGPVLAQSSGRFRFLVPDLPGHDRSAAEPYVSHAHTVRALAALIERTANGPVAVAGFSLGAQLAVLLAADRPDLVDAAVVVSAQAAPAPMSAATVALLRLAAPLARWERFARLQARELFIPPALIDDYLRTSRLLTRETLVRSVGENLRFVPPSSWARSKHPALVLAGADERRVMIDSARELHRRQPGSEMEIVDGCGHGIPLQQPGWFARRLDTWVRG